MENNDRNSYFFKPVQLIGKPYIFPPLVNGKIPVSVQFFIPNLSIGSKEKSSITKLAENCKIDVWGTDFQRASNERTKEPATLVTLAFYIDGVVEEDKLPNKIMSVSRLLVERFLGLLSFLFGIKLTSIHMQYTTINKDGSYNTILPVSHPTSRPSIKLKLPEVTDLLPSEKIFSALFWLRRGLAERDPIENYSALMVCLQIIANYLIPDKKIIKKCPSCGVEIDTQPLSITQKVKLLLVTNLGASNKLYKKIWKARNGIIAHGNKPVKAEVFLELVELKFEAINLAYKGIKLALGIPFDSFPYINQSYFVTDAFMYVD